MTDDIHSCSYYCDRPECLKRQRDELRDQLEKIAAERDAWRTLVLDHNAECKKLCHEEACIVIDSYSGCVNCPDAHSIDIPPELEPKP